MLWLRTVHNKKYPAVSVIPHLRSRKRSFVAKSNEKLSPITTHHGSSYVSSLDTLVGFEVLLSNQEINGSPLALEIVW